MVDTVVTQVLNNGPRNLVLKCTSLSDGTGESGVKKFDAASSTYANNGALVGIHVTLWRLDYDIHNMGVELLWDASSAQQLLLLGGFGKQDFKPFGGLTVPVITGATGSILLTTIGAMANSSYSLVFTLKKNIAPGGE